MFLTNSFVVMASFNKLSSFLSSSGKLSESWACIITPPARRAWRSFKFAPFLFFFSRVESRATAHG